MMPKTYTVYNDSYIADHVQTGQKIYPIRLTHIHNGDVRLTLQTEPGRKNFNQEPCKQGWLGTTNDIESWALGEYTVISVRSKFLSDGRERIDVRVR
jgi:hypothetical protein